MTSTMAAGTGNGQKPQAAVPAPILPLQESVVHRIAAGEVIQRPVSAIKEMVENSLDAGARHISVVAKEGGLKFLQIQDDGCGIRMEDLPILAQRHTTSKLRAYEDLETIGTLGFRGEALASISFVSHMSVTTMTAGSQHGHKVAYKDGEMLPPGPKPVAAVPGTVITVEDMFYNVPARRKAFKHPPEEYALMQDLLSRFAIYKVGVGFTLKRQGESRADLHTLPSASRLDNIRVLHGAELAAALLPLQLRVGRDVEANVPLEAEMSIALEGYISNLTHVGRKSLLVLFINGRPVECAQLKRAVEAMYTAQNPKATKPFMFMDLRLPARHVEVNVHPTKREVAFLHQEAIIDRICQDVERLLLSSMSSRTFDVSRLNSGALLPERAPTQAGRTGCGQQQTQGGEASASAPAYRPEKLVRTDHRTQTMDAFVVSRAAASAAANGSVRRKRSAADRDRGSDALFNTSTEAALAAAAEAAGEAGAPGAAAAPPGMALGMGASGRSVRQRPNPSEASELASVQRLLEGVDAGCHEALGEVLRDHVWVGMADDVLALLQHQTRLYLVDVCRLSRDLFYQQVLRRFGCVESIMLDEALPLHALITAALELEEAAGRWEPEDGPKEEIAELVVALLVQKAPMLEEYVGIKINESGRLTGLPVLIDGYAPDLARLPDFVLRLSRDVEWEEEEPCFRTLAEAIAAFYALQPLTPSEKPAAALSNAASNGKPSGQQQQQQQQEQQQHTPAASMGSDAMVIDLEAMELEEQQAAMAGAGATGGQGEAADRQADGSGPPHRTDTGQETAAADDNDGGGGVMAAHQQQASREWLVKHVVLPSLKAFLKPPKARARDGSVLLLTSMERLYRVFERC